MQALEAQERRVKVLLLKLRAHVAVDAALRLSAGPCREEAELEDDMSMPDFQQACMRTLFACLSLPFVHACLSACRPSVK